MNCLKGAAVWLFSRFGLAPFLASLITLSRTQGQTSDYANDSLSSYSSATQLSAH